MKRCCILGCDDKSSRRFRLPTDSRIRSLWLERTGDSSLARLTNKDLRVCAAHFDKRCLNPNGKLLRFSIPTLHLPDFHEPSTPETCFSYPPEESYEYKLPEKISKCLEWTSSESKISIDEQPVLKKPEKVYSAKKTDKKLIAENVVSIGSNTHNTAVEQSSDRLSLTNVSKTFAPRRITDTGQSDEIDLPEKEHTDHQIINQDDPVDTSKSFNYIMKDASDILNLDNEISSSVNINSEETEYDEPSNNDDFDFYEFIKPRSCLPHVPIYEESNKDDKRNMDCSQIATIDLTKIKNVKLEKPYFKGLKSFSLVSNSIHDVCRICLRLLKSEEIKKLDDQISVAGVDHLKDLLEIILPSLDLEIYSETVVCTKCTELLISSYELRKIWMLSEENFLKLIENKKEITKSDSDLIVITESKEGEVIDEYSTEDIKTNINFDHNYEENLEIPEEIPQSRRQAENGILIRKVLEQLPDLVEASSPASEIVQSHNTKVQIFHNGVKLRNNIAIPRFRGPKNKMIWGSGPYVCEKCAFSSTHLPQFRRHWYKHNRPQGYPAERKKKAKTFMCEICSQMFVSAYRLEAHFVKHQIYKCGICDKEFNVNSSLEQHIRYIHLKDYTYYQCHICGKQFTYKTTLRVHVMKHNNPNRIYKCDHCPKKFRLTRDLRNHFKRVHKNRTSVSCQFCGKTLKFVESLHKHIRLYHLNQGEGICEICSKPYWKKPDLIRHKMRVHGIYPGQASNR